MKRLIGILLFLNGMVAYSQPVRLNGLNFDHFSVRTQNHSPEFSQYLPPNYLLHPDLGIMPFDGPLQTDFIEFVDRRTENSRYFVRENSDTSDFIIQKASGPINFQDQYGWWREINYRLEKAADNLYTATNQPTPITINLDANVITILNSGFTVQIKNPVLVWRDSNGDDHSLGIPDLSNFTAGDDGVKITNVYPGIDLIYSLRRGEVESSFILNHKPTFVTGQLVLQQQITLPGNLNFYADRTGRASHQEINIIDTNNIPYFSIGKGYAFENNLSAEPQRLFSRIVNNNTLEFIVPVSWLVNHSTLYPVIIDPVVTSQNTLPLVSILGTRYSPVCWTNGCDYLMTVGTPANSTITAIRHSFEYFATGLCYSDDGGYSIDFSACHAPAIAPGVFTDTMHNSNAIYQAISVLLPEFNPCFPPPQCVPQNLDFTLHFYRCNHDPDTSCSANCVRATQPWTMFIEGHTLEMSSITSSQQICEGASAKLVVVPRYGVQPYSFLWTPGATTDDTLIVSPTSTTIYNVTITDACGITASGSTTINVTPNINPGFIVTPNPVCINTNVTLQGNGAGAASNYDWIVPGSSAPGNIINDVQAPVITYSLPGNYNVILSYPNSTCTFNDTLPLTVNPVIAASVSLTSQPSGPNCLGDTVVFRTTTVNGGGFPLYNWIVDGVNVQSGPSDSLVTNLLNNGSMVSVVLFSNAPCTNPFIDTASVFIAISNALSPQVTISPDTILCPGSSLTLNATSLNGGATPAYQWYANGISIPGANSSSYTFNVTPPDTIISVRLTSSLTCVTSSTILDTSIVNIFQNITTGVSITTIPAGAVCSGDSIQYTAHPFNGGNLPHYQWFVNGVPTGINDSVFTAAPLNNDSISVLLTSSLTCVIAATDDDYAIATISPAVNPAVILNVSPANSVCTGDTITFTAGTQNAGSTPAYSWTINGIAAGINDSIFTTSILNNNDIVRVILNSSLSCAPVASDTDFVQMTITGNVAPTVDVVSTSNVICSGGQSQFVAIAGNGGPAPVFQWYVNGVATGLTSDTILLSTLNTGDTVQTFMTSSLRCVSPTTVMSAPFIATVQPSVMPQINISVLPADTICIGQDVILEANVVNGGSIPSILWYVNSIPTTMTSQIISSSSFGQGDVIVATMTSNADCILQPGDTSNFVRVLYYPPLGVQLIASTPACPGLPATINAIPSGGNGGPYHILWSTGDADTNSITLNAGRNTSVFVQVEDDCTLAPATVNFQVPVLTGPIADFSYVNPAPGSFLNTLQFVNQSTDADSWTWFFPDSSTSTDLNPLHKFPDLGTYDVTLITVNNNGCVDSVLYHVTVKEEIAIYYPNSFSPNGDGRNDSFQPIGASLEDYELTIWDRWGEMIYKGDSKMAWDGRIKNSLPAPEGVYIFRIDLKADKFEEKVVTGRVTLIR